MIKSDKIATISTRDNLVRRISHDLEEVIERYVVEQNIPYEMMIGILENLKFKLQCEQFHIAEED